jgi:hypothetical protein
MFMELPGTSIYFILISRNGKYKILTGVVEYYILPGRSPCGA